MMLFECDRSPEYNHVYHNRCLKIFIEEELKKNKKAGLKEADVLKALRCPQCYQSTQDISEQTQKMAMMRPANRERKGSNTKKAEEKKSSGTSSQGDRDID